MPPFTFKKWLPLLLLFLGLLFGSLLLFLHCFLFGTALRHYYLLL